MSLSLEFYNLDIECIYQNYENDDENDLIYKKNLIEVFNLVENINDNDLFSKIISRIDNLIEYLKQQDLYENIKPIIKEIVDKYIPVEDESIAVIFLYSYNFFYLFHKLLVDLIRNKEINNEMLKQLSDKINE